MGKPKTPRGWFQESARHALARKGIKTAEVSRVPRDSRGDPMEAPYPRYTPAKEGRGRYVDVKEVAKHIRKKLKTAFPGTKFSVRLSRFSMGESIDVFWVDGPASDKVEDIIKHYEQVDRDAWGNILSGGNRYIMAERAISPESRKKVKDELERKFKAPTDWREERRMEEELYRTLRKTTLPNHPKARLD